MPRRVPVVQIVPVRVDLIKGAQPTIMALIRSESPSVVLWTAPAEDGALAREFRTAFDAGVRAVDCRIDLDACGSGSKEPRPEEKDDHE